MNRFPADDRVFKLFTMNPEVETADRSVMPMVAAKDDVALHQTIAVNIGRAQYLGINPKDTALTRPGHYAEGRWRCRFSSRSTGGLRLYILGERIDPDEIFMVFVEDLLLHISKPLGNEILRINVGQARTPYHRLTVIGRSGILAHKKTGDFWLPDLPTEGVKPVTNLHAAISAGKFLTKKGSILTPKYRLQTTKDNLATLYASVNACLEQKFGYCIHASHGTLLGLVREGDLIEHDDDFDCAYVSAFETCEEVSQERFEIIDHLIASGFRCKLGTTGHIKVRAKGIEIDLMPAWFDDETYNVSGFTAIPLAKEALLPFKLFNFHGTGICIPADPGAFLRLNYGVNWQVPDPFYKSVPSAKAMIHRKRLKDDQQARPDLL